MDACIKLCLIGHLSNQTAISKDQLRRYVDEGLLDAIQTIDKFLVFEYEKSISRLQLIKSLRKTGLRGQKLKEAINE